MLGTDFAGDVEAVGANVEKFNVGDAVIGFPSVGFGGHAAYCTMAQDGALARKPDRLSYAQAAAVPFGGMAALAFLRDKGKLKAGEHVAIVGASGSVGSAANAKMALAIGADRDGKRQIARVAAERVEDLRFLAALAEAGHFTPFVDREYDLADAAQAHAYIATGRKRGNVVLTMG